mgnify:CR=1 FL=1
MKTEPTAATAASIYGIMDLELADLNIEPGTGAFSSAKSATGYAETAAGALLDEMDDLICALKSAEAETDPRKLHGHFTEMYRAAIDAAGRSVRLAAIARLGIIQSDTMARYDRADPGAFYG